MADAVPARSVQDFLDSVTNIKPPPYTDIRLYRGQGEPKDLLPSLFRILRGKVHVVRETEAKLLKHLKDKIPERTPSRPKDDWDWLSFGQHYRLPTRMLDWSKNPLVALFFAVEGSPISPVVYVYHAQKPQIVDSRARRDSPANIAKTRIMIPSVHSVRVALQESWHTVHRLHPRKSGGKMVIPLADMDWHKGRLRTVRIDSTRAGTICRELASMGIYHATIYGNFEDVCAEVRRQMGL